MTNALDYKRLAAAAGHAQRLAGHLHGATAYRICERSSADMLINDAIKELRDCAAAMGLDVVETLSPQQAHEELLAKRRAEDGEADRDAGAELTIARADQLRRRFRHLTSLHQEVHHHFGSP